MFVLFSIQKVPKTNNLRTYALKFGGISQCETHENTTLHKKHIYLSGYFNLL